MSDDIVTKAKITTSLGTFEFEGTETYVSSQIDKIMEKSQNMPASNIVQEKETSETDKTTPPKTASKQNARKATIEQPKLLSNLIIDSEKIRTLKEFVVSKRAQNHQELFSVLAHWMKTNLSLEDVSIDEMWTAYKILSKKPPKVLIQVFRDAKSKKGWFTTGAEVGKYILTPIGETFVEHDLPPAELGAKGSE